MLPFAEQLLPIGDFEAGASARWIGLSYHLATHLSRGGGDDLHSKTSSNIGIKIVRQAVTFITSAKFVDTTDNIILDIDPACAVFRGIGDQLSQH